MPTTDWQFWVVTAIAAFAAWRLGAMLLRAVRPAWGKRKGATRRATLTISAGKQQERGTD